MDTRHPVLTIPSTFAVVSSSANSAALLCRRIQDRRLERLAVGGARVARREGAASVAPPEVDRGSASFLPCFSLEHVCRQQVLCTGRRAVGGCGTAAEACGGAAGAAGERGRGAWTGPSRG